MSTASLSEKAYQHIRQQVFAGALAPGDRLVNRTLAKQLGTSFIPVREAISRLASEGLVQQVAGAGAFVRTFDRQEISISRRRVALSFQRSRIQHSGLLVIGTTHARNFAPSRKPPTSTLTTLRSEVRALSY
jgi:DNA-binding FadR family transcriptional regulator